MAKLVSEGRMTPEEALLLNEPDTSTAYTDSSGDYDEDDESYTELDETDIEALCEIASSMSFNLDDL